MSAVLARHGGRSIRGRPRTLNILIGLLLVLSTGAIQGGAAMVIDPVGPLGMTVEFLEKTPVADYFWPGVFLLAIGGASLLTALGLVFGWTWRWAAGLEQLVGHRWPWLGAVSVGSILFSFEVVELLMVPFHPVMHPLSIAISTAIVALAVAPASRAYLRVIPR